MTTQVVTQNSKLAVIKKNINQSNNEGKLDHFICKDNKIFAGNHLIVDIWGANNLNDEKLMEQTFLKTIERAGATLLHINLHKFSKTGGLSGVAILAESHISVHTWPECDFAAFDVFMCGKAEPEKLIEVLKENYNPTDIKSTEIRRGIIK